MKTLKNFTLISLLLATCIPTETKPMGAHIAPSGLELISALIIIPAICFSVIYFPYKFLTRHSSVEKFVEFQEDIESYTITLKIRQRRKILCELQFTGSDYQKVVREALTYAQSQQSPRAPKRTFKERFTQPAPVAKVATFSQRIKLFDDETVYNLATSTIRLVTPTKLAETTQWKRLEKKLTQRFRV